MECAGRARSPDGPRASEARSGGNPGIAEYGDGGPRFRGDGTLRPPDFALASRALHPGYLATSDWERSMRWDELPRSDNIEDRRGEGGYSGGGGFPIGTGGMGIGTLVVLGVVGWALGIAPRLLIGGAEILSGGDHSYHTPYRAPTHTGAPSDRTGQFVSAVLGSTETVWRDLLEKDGVRYRPPTLVMFSGATRSACGSAQAAMGPLYCPNDQRVYLDTSFFRDLQRRFRGCDSSKACEFSQAYVIAHEVGHHVQNLR